MTRCNCGPGSAICATSTFLKRSRFRGTRHVRAPHCNRELFFEPGRKERVLTRRTPHLPQTAPINKSQRSTSRLIKACGRPNPGSVSSQPSSSMAQFVERNTSLTSATTSKARCRSGARSEGEAMKTVSRLRMGRQSRGARLSSHENDLPPSRSVEKFQNARHQGPQIVDPVA